MTFLTLSESSEALSPRSSIERARDEQAFYEQHGEPWKITLIRLASAAVVALPLLLASGGVLLHLLP